MPRDLLKFKPDYLLNKYNIVRLKIRKYIALGLVLLLVFSCGESTKDRLKNELENVLDNYKHDFIKDSRVVYWNSKIEISGKNKEVLIETDNTKILDTLSVLLAKKYPDVNFTFSLLPEKEKKRVVHALINNSVANLRSNPQHSAELSTQVLLGTPVKVLKYKKGWYLVQTPNKYLAWTDAANITLKTQEELAEQKNLSKIVFTKQYGFSYEKPSEESQVVTDLVAGCILPVSEQSGEYFEVIYPDNRVGFVKKSDVIELDALLNKSFNRDELVLTAKKFFGIPYLWGGTSSKGIDCSGFTSNIYFLNGILLQRDASQQTKYGIEVTKEPDFSKLDKGDLLFFGRVKSDSLPEKVTHVGMYIGDTEFIHASGRVKINSLDSTRENFAAHYVPRFVRAVRITDSTMDEGIQLIKENDFYKEILVSNNESE